MKICGQEQNKTPLIGEDLAVLLFQKSTEHPLDCSRELSDLEVVFDKVWVKNSDETTITPSVSAVIPMYYSGMEDVGVDDDVFIQLSSPSSPSFMAPLPPEEGSTDGTVNNSTVTFAKGAADAREAEANPGGLDWHHGEKHLMAVQDELKASTMQTSKESMDAVSPSKDKESPQSKQPDPTSMEGLDSLIGMNYDPSGGCHWDNTTGNNDLTEEPEDNDILGKRHENWRGVGAESNKYPRQVVLPNTEEMSKDETYSYKDREKTKPEEPESKLTAGKVDCGGVHTDAPTHSSFREKDDDLKSSETPELWKYNQNIMGKATDQLQVSETATEVSIDDDEHVDTRSLNYRLAKHDWVRRESGISETLKPRLSISEGCAETLLKEEQGQGCKKIACTIQQGEQLLQRLQLVQQRQDVHSAEDPHSSYFQQIVPEMAEKEVVTGTEEDDMKAVKADPEGLKKSRSVEDDGLRTNLMEEEKSENVQTETKAWLSLPTMSVKPEHYPVTRSELVDSDDDKSDIWRPADWTSNDEVSSSQIPLASSRPRLSVAETSLEKQIHEAAQKKQNLQRAGGVFNLADNLDVIEIPFKTNFLLESFPTKAGQDQQDTWQFSEHKMQKEICQEIQRELALVNQGKIPGAYSKGEVRQLRDTKLFFEAFQQENVEGPTRHRKSPVSLSKGHVFPSVLERTRSLEMFSLRSHPVSREPSLRVNDSAQMKKSLEEFRAKSPSGSLRDKIRSWPYQKQDKHARQYRSMDLISSAVSAAETRKEITEVNVSGESPILQHNPFFKLRPALGLQPEVEKDIREAKEREEELRRQRCTLYGENKWKSKDKDKSRFKPALITDATELTRGKLERHWPPPSKIDQKPEQTQQEAKVRRTGGQKTILWQRWESGQINGQPSQEKN